MITCEQAMLWLAIVLIVGSAVMFGIAFLIARHYSLRFRHGAKIRVKAEMLMSERMRAKQEADQAAAHQIGRVVRGR